MFDFSLIQKADISLAEFAQLIRYKDVNGEVRSITRAAVHRWVIGATTPSNGMDVRVSKVLGLVKAAINAKDLPLRLGTPRKERKRLVVEAVIKHLHKAEV